MAITTTDYWRLAEGVCAACGHEGAMVLWLTRRRCHDAGRGSESATIVRECRYCGFDEPWADLEAAGEDWHPADFEGRDPSSVCHDPDVEACARGYRAPRTVHCAHPIGKL